MRLQYRVLLIIGLITALLTVVIYYAVSAVVMSSAIRTEREQGLHLVRLAESMLRQQLDLATSSPYYLQTCEDCLTIADSAHWVSDRSLAALLKALPARSSAQPSDEEVTGWTAVGATIYRYRFRPKGEPLLALIPLSASIVEQVERDIGHPLKLAVEPRDKIRSGVVARDDTVMEATLLLAVDMPAVGAGSEPGQSGISLRAGIERSFTAQARHQIHYLLGLLYVLATAIAVTAVLMVKYMVTRRIARLREKAQNIASDGNPEGLFQVSGNDEIRELANDFNRMIKAIALAQQQLKQAQQEAEQASAAKSQFLANMSHEIRTPLTVVLGYADLAADEQVSERERCHYIEIIQRHGEQLVGVINDVLDLAKIEAGRLSINQEIVDIRALVHEITDMLKLSAYRKNIVLVVKVDALVPAFLQSDTLRLKQILINLVSNAIKFTFEGSVSIHVRVADTHLDQPVVLVDVIDSGIGMDAATLENLFDAFHQADNSSTRRFGGTGLGLTIAKQLCELLGGALNVESTLHQGSRFQASLPLIAPANDRATVNMSSVPRLQGILVKQGTRALIVDDNAVIRLLVRKMLARLGFDIEECTNGAEACQRVLEGAERFDVIVMDMHMPEMDGIQATRCLRAAQVATPIIGLTANVMDADRQRLFDAGCNAFLSKPIEMERFYDVLIKCLGQSIVSLSDDEITA